MHNADTAMVLQNPVITVAWSTANYVLQGQIMGFKVDTWPHCQGPSSNRPMIAVSVIIVIFAHGFVAANFLFTHRPLSLYRFPSKFRNQFWGILIAAAGVFVFARALRQILRRKQQDRQRAIIRDSGGSRQLNSSLHLGIRDRTLPRSQLLTTLKLSNMFRWVTFTAPKIVPLVPKKPVVVPAARLQSRTTPKSSAGSISERV